MELLPHRFRPPKNSEEKKWEVVKFLVTNGFYYQHIIPLEDYKSSSTSLGNYVAYSDNLKDAKEFVEKYK